MRALIWAMALVVGTALSGCASIDNSLFGGGAGAGEPSTVPPPETSDTGDEGADQSAAVADQGAADAPSGQTAAAAPAEGTPVPPPQTGPDEGAVAESSSAPIAGTLPSTAPAEAEPPPGGAPVASTRPTAAPVARSATTAGVAAVIIAPGASTGTSVNQTIAGIRASLQEVESRLMGAAQQFGSLRSSSAQQLSAYYQAQAQISAHLQIGTTRGNPELVSQWNAAQAALDQLTANINGLNTLSSQINGEASRTRGLVSQIQSTFDVPGAVDEDHRQLTVLEDEGNQTVVVLDRLGRDVSTDLRRQTASLNNERTRLAQLQGAIKNGDLYASGSGVSSHSGVAANAPAVTTGGGAPGAPVLTIRFARAKPDYQKPLYDALTQALQNQPGASFDVIGVSPTRGSAAAVQTAQSTARRRAQDVMHTMTEMGVPATRMALSATTDPSVSVGEVRVFLR
jgi:hypothetical protein